MQDFRIKGVHAIACWITRALRETVQIDCRTLVLPNAVAALTDTFDLELLKGRLRRKPPASGSDQGEPVAAVAIIINPNDRGGSILLIRRTERVGDPWSGQMAFPGGHKSHDDRDFLATAIREAREEVGIDLEEHELVGQLPVMYSRTRQVPVASYVFQLKASVAVQSNDEVACLFLSRLWGQLRPPSGPSCSLCSL